MHLAFPSDAVVVVAGVPGAGKTTLIRRAVDRAAVRVIDTDDRRTGPRRPRPGLYAGHYLRILLAILLGRRPVVIHSRGTHGVGRRAILALSRLRGRPAHLLLLDAPRAVAEAGQRARGRVLRRAVMDREMARWSRLIADVRLDAGRWESVSVLDRSRTACLTGLRFATPLRLPGPGTAARATGSTASRAG